MLDEGKIANAVAAALQAMGDDEDRLVRFLEFLAQLEGDPKWTPAEISAVQARVSKIIHSRPS